MGDEAARASAIAAGLSALFAFLTLLFAVWVDVRTRALLRPFERPVLSLVDGEEVRDASDEIGYSLLIKNTGQRPARKIHFRARAAPESDLENLVALPGWAPANDYQPGSEMRFPLWPLAPFHGITLVQVEVRYADSLTGKPLAPESYWLRIFPGQSSAVTGMDQEKRDLVERTWLTWPAAAVPANHQNPVTN